ncbi:serine/threonine-protein kinase 10-like isoform X9 [Homarus americanus]|uniref:serine/threonine-protein kinase 10-like isoform X9 n=1 Tax=Homarus americanus TaxID=6706 RepID=UPI001C474064|nr:serine/threonine-protein kinase 10-like isoform X9 [Homarus americanus]
MPLISKFKDIFKGGSSAKKKKHFHNVRLDNPEEFWDIIGELGDGAYGKVYKAVHKETKQLAALKQVALEEEEDLETFMIEIDILSECKHENIVELLEAYHFTGKLWMYLEYCDGGAMDSIMADLYRPLTEPQIAYVCKYLVEALVYIHDQKVIHRDLKAGNVLLTMEGGVKLADFGVSAKNKNTYDKRGTFIGTPYWLAPEVILCETFIDAKYDYKADVWSLGISLIEFAQMDPPNHEVSPVRVMLKIQKSDPPKLNYPSKYSKEFNDFISKCLVKDPSLRPTAVELLKHPFISKDLDVKPIRDLLLEYKAEVVDEEVDEDGDDQRFSRISEDDPSHEDTFSVTPNAISKENKPPSPGKDENEVVAPDSGERRKGPAPPPPVSGSPASVSSTPSKKGPAPAVPASTTPSKPRAPSPVDVPSDDLVGPAIVDKNSKDEVETPSSPEVQDSISHPPTSTSPSLSEAEEQAVQILESAIASVGDTVSSKSSQEDGEDSNVTLASTSVILTPEKEKKLDTVVLSDQVVAADQVKAPDSSAKDKDEGITEVQVIPNDGHKLDESEVVISNSSILHDGMDTQPDPNAASKSRYEITLEETAQVEEIPPSVLSANDTTHISVVAVDDLSEAASSSKDTPSSQKDSLVSSKTPPPAPVDQKTTTTRSPVQSEQDHQGHLETSSNISNISNLSGGTTSTGRSVSSAEEENRPTMSLLIEGTTVSATDVDDDEVFDHSENNESKTAKESSANKPALVRELTIGSEVSVESGVSAGSTVSTPSHQTDYSQQSTPVANSPVTKILPNGIGKDAHRLERSEWDNVSTTSSERENRHRERDDESLDEVVLRRPQQADLSDVTIQPLEKNREGRNARATKQENDLLALRKKTRKRTRKFVVDGVVVTTRQVFYEDEGMGTGHFSRKQELRELKILQKIEQKQFQELAVKANFAKAEQEKKFDLERQQLLRGYDTEIEALNRQQKQQVEKAEALQEVELKNASKKIRAEQERELKAFRESLKTELKLLKQEVDLLPKDKRKEAFKSHKERLDVDQSEREKSFLEKLHETHEVSLKRLGDDHRERIALLERQFLQQKHQFLRSRESALWEMEERHLHEKHQLSKRQLKDIFFLQRHQMLLRHDKELEQVKRVNQHMEEELIKRQQIEKRQLPKRIRQEMKARELMFRESMRISTSHLPDSHEDEKNKLKKFQENEKRRYEAEKKRAEQKHQRKLEELQAASEYTVKELEQLQNEKRKMLMEHETNKLKSQDEEYQREVREWKENLKPRKQGLEKDFHADWIFAQRTHLDYQKLEEEFEKQLNEQEQFYGAYLCRGLGSSVTPSQSTSSLARSNTS